MIREGGFWDKEPSPFAHIIAAQPQFQAPDDHVHPDTVILLSDGTWTLWGYLPLMAKVLFVMRPAPREVPKGWPIDKPYTLKYNGRNYAVGETLPTMIELSRTPSGLWDHLKSMNSVDVALRAECKNYMDGHCKWHDLCYYAHSKGMHGVNEFHISRREGKGEQIDQSTRLPKWQGAFYH